MKSRVLIQLCSEAPFGGSLNEVGIYENFNEAVDQSLKLINETVKTIIINDGAQYVLIYKKKQN